MAFMMYANEFKGNLPPLTASKSTAPNGKQWRLLRAKILLKSGIERDIVRIVKEEIELKAHNAGKTQ